MKAERIGVVVVLAALAAIATMIYLVFDYQVDNRLKNVRSQGVSMVRALSAIPYSQLSPGGERQQILQVLRHGIDDREFAYVSIVDNDGRVIHEVAGDGVIAPPAEPHPEPSTWLGERETELSNDGRPVIEFHAPLLDAGELKGFVRIGFVRPTAGVGMNELPFVAAVSLPVFLLVPLFYGLLRMEVRPVRKASDEISRMMEGDAFRSVEISATGELGDFMRRFNSFVELASSRIESLEHDQTRLITNNKLLTYRKNRVETVLETLPEAVLILDESGAITFANQKLAAMFDVNQETILSQPPQSWCNHPDVLQLLSKYQVNSSGRHFTDTIRFRIDEAAERAIATRTYPLFAPGTPSSAVGTLIIFRDETKEALARQARADFVGHLSHELKSPLNVLAMYSEQLLSEAGKDEGFRIEAANIIVEEVDRLSSLVSGLLNVTQIENGSLSPERSLVKLRDVASAAFDEARASGNDRDLRFTFNAPKEMNPVYVDKDLLRIAITNLLSNAVKYNRDGGSVTLTIEETDDAVQIRVADTGVGISEEDQARVFEKFFRSSDESIQAVGGHGLGLALTKQIIELHHGTLALNRDRDEGAEFIINLWKESTAFKQAI